MKENITLDPEYANLIIEVNKLKDTVAQKIAERDMLAFHIVPDIETAYLNKLGLYENRLFLENMKLLRVLRKIDIYKESEKLNIAIDDSSIENQLRLEFSDIEHEYKVLQASTLFHHEDEDISDEMTQEYLKLTSVIYKNLIKKLSPLINFNNTRLDNQLYALLEKAYRDLDLTMMSKLESICELRNNDSVLTIGDVKTLKKAKKTYERLIDENEGIILNIKCSDSYNKKKILEDEKLIEKTKEQLTRETELVQEEYKKAKKELDEIENG